MPIRARHVFLFVSLLPASAMLSGETGPAAGVIRLEAEDGELAGVAVETLAPGFEGRGYVAGFDAADDAVSWTFAAPAGSYRLVIRHRTEGGGGKGFEARVNDTGVTGHFSGREDFGPHRSDLVFLRDGENTLRIGGGWNHYEIDLVTLEPEPVPAPPAPVPAVPVNPRASESARRLLATLAGRYGKATFSGQQETDEFAFLSAASGRTPAVFSGDLIEYTPSRLQFGSRPGDYTERVVALARQGHLISLCWHWNAPAGLLDTPERRWWSGFYANATTFDFAAALADPEGADHALLLRDIDAVAAQLKKLQDADVPVLWRPLHESEGGWFWWGAKGPQPFKQLWRLTYDRLVRHHGLNNLVWVLTSEDPAWYPGDDVVDIVGVDAYPPTQTDALVTRWENLRARFDGKKLVALTEFGGVPDIEKMQARGVWWSYFASWSGETHGPRISPVEQVARVYRSPSVLNLEDIAPRPATLADNAPASVSLVEHRDSP